MGILYEAVPDHHKTIIIDLGEAIYKILNLQEKTYSDILQIISESNQINNVKIKEAYSDGKKEIQNEIDQTNEKNNSEKEIMSEKIRTLEILIEDNQKSIQDETNKWVCIINQNNDTSQNEKVSMQKTMNKLMEQNSNEYEKGRLSMDPLIKEKDIIIKEKGDQMQLITMSNNNLFERGLSAGKKSQENLVLEKDKRIYELLKQNPDKILNTNQKGDALEEMINDKLVKQIDRFAVVEDTSDIRGSGDRIIKTPSVNIMVELKNKPSGITRSDLDQFTGHYEIDMDNGKYNIAIMISDGCGYILNKGTYKFETYKNNLIGYVSLSPEYSTDQKNKMIIDFVCNCLDKYKHLDTNKHDTDSIQELLTNSLLDIHNDILQIEKYDLPTINNINQKYEGKKKKLQGYINKMESFDYPIPIEIQKSNGNDEMFINKIMQKIKHNNIKNIPKQNWRDHIIKECSLEEFYIKFLNKKGITRDLIIKTII